MERLTIACVRCGRVWTAAVSFTLYEQQAAESRPCPACGSNTLCCREPAAPARRRRGTVAAIVTAKAG